MSSVPTLPVHVITAVSAVQLWKLCDFRHVLVVSGSAFMQVAAATFSL